MKSRTVAHLSMLAAFALSIAKADPATTTVSITLSGLPSTEGVVYVGLCDEAGWERFDCANAQLTPDPNGVVHVWTDVTPGTYGITVLHDANRNGKMDFNFFGAPEEKWGSSNNPPPRMGRSKWQDVKFEVGAAPVTLNIRMQ